jgi:hypothetical protein
MADDPEAQDDSQESFLGERTDPNIPSSAALKPKEEWTQEELDQLEKERAEILDPDNRPENAEIDNTGRTFDSERGDFVDQLDGEEPPGGEDSDDPA